MIQLAPKLKGLVSASFKSKATLLLNARNMASFYDFKTKTLEGEDLSMSSFKGKAVLIENTASL